MKLYISINVFVCVCVCTSLENMCWPMINSTLWCYLYYPDNTVLSKQNNILCCFELVALKYLWITYHQSHLIVNLLGWIYITHVGERLSELSALMHQPIYACVIHISKWVKLVLKAHFNFTYNIQSAQVKWWKTLMQ